MEKQFAQATEYYESAIALAHECGDAQRAGELLNNLGVCCAYLGQSERAMDYYHQALRWAVTTGYIPAQASSTYNLACLYARNRQSARACQWLEKAIALLPSYREMAQNDADFDRIRDVSCFRALTGQPKERQTVTTSGSQVGVIGDNAHIEGGIHFFSIDRYRLDAAIPEQVYLEKVFDVAAAIRLPDSPLLKEDDLAQVKSSEAQIAYPEGKTYAHLRIQVTAPQCRIEGADYHTCYLAQGYNSPVFYFHLTPKQTGNISIIITLHQKDDTLGSTRLRTTVVQRLDGESRLDIISRPISSIIYNITVQNGGTLQAGVIGNGADISDGVHFDTKQSHYP